MDIKDLKKLDTAGFIIIRPHINDYLIERLNPKTGKWEDFETDFKDNIAMVNRLDQLLKNSKFIQL